MLTEQRLEQGGCAQIEVRCIERAALQEVYLTARIGAEGGTAEHCARLFEQLARELVERSVIPIAEKVFGLDSARESILSQRAAGYARADLPADWPLTFIEGRPIADAAFAGVQLWGVVPQDPQRVAITSLGADANTPSAGRDANGRIISAPGLRWLYLAAIDGAEGEARQTLPIRQTLAPAQQAERMFARADELVRRAGFAYAQVARTWLYCARLLDWYDDLNAVRSAHHRRVGLRSDNHGPILPASTGIEGRTDAQRACLMDLIALDLDPDVDAPATLEPIRRTARQGAAASYGSGFSRGMSLTWQGKRTLFVSGTASIDESGQSTHHGDAEAQSLATLLAIASLLDEHGATLGDVCAALVYCKTPAVYATFQRVSRLLGLTALPHVAVLADVCRPELLIEIEVVACADQPPDHPCR
jgi:enamine deaminase RidA (YjgF/YER057c/UK114 family)